MRRARRFAGLVLANVVLGLLLSACASPEAASELAPTLSLKMIGGNRIAFQNGIPVPTFSYQPRRRLDLGGLWRLQSTPMNHDLSLATQRFARLPNFAGICVGSNNAGYASDLWSSLPIPDRPWGEAMTSFFNSPQPRVPRGPSLGAPELPFEQPVKTEAEFTKYVDRYETAFQQYGYFAEAVREVSTRFVFTSGSFGSAPGAGPASRCPCSTRWASG